MSYSQNLLPTGKAFLKETTPCIWFTQKDKVHWYNIAAGVPDAVT